MKKQAVLILTVFGMVLFAQVGGWAQKDTPASRMPCDKMLKLGADKYLSLADKEDGSTNGMVQAAAHYTDCRKQHNLTSESRLPKSRQPQIKTVRDALNSLSETVYGYTIIVEGGGTMYRVMQAYDLADNEDTVAHLIALLQHPDSHRSSDRRHAAADMAHASHLFLSLNKPHAANPDDAKTYLPSYRQQYAEAKVKLIQLQHLIPLLPSAAAALLAHQVLMQMKDAFANASG